MSLPFYKYHLCPFLHVAVLYRTSVVYLGSVCLFVCFSVCLPSFLFITSAQLLSVHFPSICSILCMYRCCVSRNWINQTDTTQQGLIKHGGSYSTTGAHGMRAHNSNKTADYHVRHSIAHRNRIFSIERRGVIINFSLFLLFYCSSYWTAIYLVMIP